jgi:hypothetical protein
MFMAGYGLNTKQLAKMGPSPILMGIIPCLFEGFVVGGLIIGFGELTGTNGGGIGAKY